MTSPAALVIAMRIPSACWLSNSWYAFEPPASKAPANPAIFAQPWYANCRCCHHSRKHRGGGRGRRRGNVWLGGAAGAAVCGPPCACGGAIVGGVVGALTGGAVGGWLGGNTAANAVAGSETLGDEVSNILGWL